MSKKIKFLLIYTLIIAVSVAVFVELYPLIYPFAGISLPLSKEQLKQRAYQIAEELDIDTRGMYVEVRLQRYTKVVRQAQMEKGLEESNKLFRKGLPGYFWRVYWINESQSFASQLQPEQVEDDGTQGPLADQRWQIDTRGNFLHFERKTESADSLMGISVQEARQIIQGFFLRYTGFYDSGATRPGETLADYKPPPDTRTRISADIRDSKVIQLTNRIDYESTWTAVSPELGDTIRIQVNITGNEVSHFDVEYEVPKTYSSQSKSPVSAVFSSLLFLAIAITTIIIAFKRWRAYELSFGFAIPLGIIVGFLFGINLYQSLPPSMGWTMIFPLIFAPLMIGGTLIFVWAVGESVARETWNEKFVALDLIRTGYLLHSEIGKNLIRGIALGALSFALWLILVNITEKLTPMMVISQDQEWFRFIDSYSPMIQFFSFNIFAAFYTVAAYVVLGLSLLRRRISSPYIFLPLVALFLVLAHQSSIQPLSLGVVIEGLGLLLILWSFYRFDIITCFIALFTAITLEMGLSLFYFGDAGLLTSGYWLISIFALIIIYSITTIFAKDRISDFKRIAPSYVKNITERQRMQQELEIAREVQMSFLPASNPTFTQLDIASACIPALEVGGDYFDFIHLGPKRLGVVIGDVSGKGTQAAFYMTLTKGFLRALANMSESPAFVLTQLNRLFYDNVKRGVFISMVYGIFDMEKGQLTLARAGHNPVVMHKTKARELEMINPRGLALGMEKGERFQQMIQEVTISFQYHDLLVFYTDGFTEAMNKNKEEYGEERFEMAIEKHSNGSAEEVMQSIFKDVRNFSGRTPQHDDMTIVVVKVREDKTSGVREIIQQQA